ncbi:MAG: type II toxin-antitoxin system death-on-curing family toxin [Acetobacteraceae bacterium]|nr:type II toxin-antitoxin system death-on-curing family toxin [Acetobacteraceae bacterium]
MIVWLSRQLTEAIHDEQLAQHGGAPGLRDEGLLEDALARPLNLASYDTGEMADLAAMYALVITRNHPFVAGNKRTACLALETFLALNGCRFLAGDPELVVIMRSIAAGEITDAEFTNWVRGNVRAP